MRDGRIALLAEGIASATFVVGALAATQIINAEDKFGGETIIAFIMSLLFAMAAVICAALAVRTYVLRILQSVSIRVEKIVGENYRQQFDLAEGEFKSTLNELRATLETVEQNQRQTLSVAKKDENFQHVLNKLIATERRMLISSESVALTTAEQVAAVANSAAEDLRARSSDFQSELASTRKSVESIQLLVQRQLPRIVDRIGSLDEALTKEMRSSNQQLVELRANLRGVQESLGVLDERVQQGSEQSLAQSTLLDEVIRGRAPRLEQLVDSASAAVNAAEVEFRESSLTLNQTIQSLGKNLDGTNSLIGKRYSELCQRLATLADRLDVYDEAVKDLAPRLETPMDKLSAQISSLHPLVENSVPYVHEQLAVLRDSLEEILNAKVAYRGNSSDGCAGAAEEFQHEAVKLNETVHKVLHLTDTAKNDVKALHRHVERTGIDTVRQVESLLQLFARVDSSSSRFPESGGFAMNPDSILLLSDLIQQERPKHILELGSGASTIWMGTFARSIGSTVTSIEHLDEYLALTTQMIGSFGLDQVVELKFAPLENVEIGDKIQPWYGLEAFTDIGKIEMLIVDGPPESTGSESRFPAFPILREYLAHGALIVVDDVHRPQEARMVECWLQQDENLSRTNWKSGRTEVLRYGDVDSRSNQ